MTIESEPNNTLEDANQLSFITLTGGGSINDYIIVESLGDGDDVDFFYFTHKESLSQAQIELTISEFDSRIGEGGVFGERAWVTITNVGDIEADTLAVEMVTGNFAYIDEWNEAFIEFHSARGAVDLEALENPDRLAAQVDQATLEGLIDPISSILEQDGQQVDGYDLGAEIEQLIGVGAQTADGQRAIAAASQLAQIYKKWETPIYRNANTGEVLIGSWADVIWATTGTSTAFKVEGGHTLASNLDINGLEVELDVPTIEVSAKQEILGVLPTNGDDKWTGTAAPEYYDALAGNDTLDGGKGNDTLLGNVGDDSIEGGDGDDELDGGPGKDTIDGGAGNDTIRGGSENDRLIGGGGTDWIDAFAGNDTIDAGNGNDTVLAGSGNDSVKAGGGADFVNGEEGKDTVDGGAGSDTIAGGAGKDSLTGGGGNDVFLYAAAGDSRGGSIDIITDFDRAGNDRINLEDIFGGTLKFRGEKAFKAAGQVRVEVKGDGVAVKVNLDSNKATVELEIQLAGTSISTVTSDDFFL
jgi:Ca2+-binding RTX toxin-like protein